MKYIFKNLSEIKNKLAKRHLALLLDFDLTLSPLARDPRHAYLPKAAKNKIGKVVQHIPVVIITGRALGEIKKKANIKKVFYIGSHGLEYNLNGKQEAIAVPNTMLQALKKAQKKFLKISKKYPNIILETKKYSVALGYRMVRPSQIRPLEFSFRKMAVKIKKEGLLSARLDKKTFELRPKVKIDKGVASLFALKTIQNKFHKRFLPIYIGDSQTDEDAFKVLDKRGITVRVGRNKKSAAKWYLKNQKEVNRFLEWLANLLS